MSNSLKVQQDGTTVNHLGVIHCEYSQTGDIIDVTIKVLDERTQDIETKVIEMQRGDVAYLVNSYGTTVDTIKIK